MSSNLIYRLIVCVLFFFMMRAGGDVYAQRGKFWEKGIGKLILKADSLLYASQMSGIDSSYIDRPELNRQVYFGSFNYLQFYDFHLPFDNSDAAGYMDDMEPYQYYNVNMHTFQAEFDLGIDYKGLCIELPIPLHNLYNISLGLARTGSVWGFRIRYKYMRHMNGSVKWGMHDYYKERGIDMSDLYYENIPDNLNNLKTLYLEGYYVLNNKRFSLSAGVFADMVQKRSQGSMFLMGNWHRSLYTGEQLFHGDKETFRLSQISLGAGYGYNLVMCNRKLLVHASLIPMFSAYQKVSHSIYETDNVVDKGDIKDYEYDKYYYAVDATPKFVVNGFARLAMSYNWHKHYLFTFLLNYRQYLYSNKCGFNIHNYELDSQVNIAYRF